MKKKTFLSGSMVVGALLLTGAGCAGNTQSDTPLLNNTAETRTDAADSNQQVDAPSQQSGRYEAYEESKLALANTGDVVLFFKADWCPSCRALEKDILSKKDQIPADLTILTLDYDTELELRKKYGVTTQHTLVQVDSQGNKIKKWSADTTLKQFISHVE